MHCIRGSQGQSEGNPVLLCGRLTLIETDEADWKETPGTWEIQY